jgi:hypothetical protein
MSQFNTNRTVKIAFDTNQAFVGPESKHCVSALLSKQLTDLITKMKRHANLNVAWYIPEVVKHERQYQMERHVRALEPAAVRLQTLIGNAPDLSQDVLLGKMRGLLEDSIVRNGLNELSLRDESVEWRKLMMDAVYRNDPFEAASEKGFRDALIVETFLQLVEASQKQPYLRIFLLTADIRMTKAIVPRIEAFQHVKIVASVQELRGELTALEYDIDEATLTKWGFQAYRLFNECKCVFDRVPSLAADLGHMGDLPPATQFRHNDSDWQVAPPEFMEKSATSIRWYSEVFIVVQAGIYMGRMQSAYPPPYPPAYPSPYPPANRNASMYSPLSPDYLYGSNFGSGLYGSNAFGYSTYDITPDAPQPVNVFSGRDVYGVEWKADFDAEENLTNPSILSVKHVGLYPFVRNFAVDPASGFVRPM